MRRGSLLVFASFLLASLGFAQEDELSLTWPKLIESDEGTLIVHQPTIENFANGTVTGRSAVVLEPVEGDDEQVFGAARFSATTTGTAGSESVDVSRITVDQLEFPDSESAAIARRIIESAVSDVSVSVPTAYLERGVQLSGIQQRQQQQAKFNTDAPMVYVESEPTLLVLIDGDPTLTSTSQRGVTRVANTPFDLLRLDSTDKYYLRAGDNWFVADGVLEPWQVESTPPQAVKTVAEQGRRDVELPDAADIPDAPSQIIVSTDPAMLVQVDGEPDLSAIEGTDLLYVRNTASDVLYHIPSQAYYLHDLGRWYRSRDLNDPSGWAAVSLERLPQSLKNIPLDSPLADIRESVPGTPESQQAAIEAQIPQTAQVDRDSASLDVTYQGEPDFQAIEGTDLTYATNTQYPVVYADDSYYSVHDGVWFNSYAPYGPWRVASYVPSSIYGIPSWHPLYPITYVYLTYATPRYAYFSYWPGYTGRYNHFGHVYFGTGWRYSRYYWNHYDPWYWGSHYYGSSYLPGFSFFINITFRDRDHYYDRYRYSRYRYDRHRRYNRRA